MAAGLAGQIVEPLRGHPADAIRRLLSDELLAIGGWGMVPARPYRFTWCSSIESLVALVSPRSAAHVAQALRSSTRSCRDQREVALQAVEDQIEHVLEVIALVVAGEVEANVLPQMRELFLAQLRE